MYVRLRRVNLRGFDVSVPQGMHKITLKGTPEQEFARNVCTQHVQKGLQTKPEYTKYRKLYTPCTSSDAKMAMPRLQSRQTLAYARVE